MDRGLNERIGLIEKRLNTIEEDLQLFLRRGGVNHVKLRKNVLEVELRELEMEKVKLEEKSADVRRRLEEAGIFVGDITEKRDILLKKIEEIDQRLDKMKINRLVIPFLTSLIIIIVMVSLYLLMILWG